MSGAGKAPESVLAHRYCDPLGHGLEIGGAAHNPFHIHDTRNVDIDIDPDWTGKPHQFDICGEILPVDVVAFGDDLPLADSSEDFLVSAHVFEHMPDPLKAIFEWSRVVRDGGIIYTVVPYRDASPLDVGRPLTTIAHCVGDYLRRATTETHPIWPLHGKYGHYHVYTQESFLDLVAFSNALADDLGLNRRLVVIDQLAVCDKVANGFAVVCRVEKTA